MKEVYVFFYITMDGTNFYIDEFKFVLNRLKNTIKMTEELKEENRKRNLLIDLFGNMAHNGTEVYRSAIINYLAMWENVQRYMNDNPDKTICVALQIVKEEVKVLPFPYEGFTTFRDAWYSQIPDHKPELYKQEEMKFSTTLLN